MNPTNLFRYVSKTKPVGREFFAKLTDPGRGDPALTRLGFDLRQSIAGVSTYTYTAINGAQPLTLAWLNVTAAGEMYIQTSAAPRTPVTLAALTGLIAALVAARPELKHPIRFLTRSVSKGEESQ